MLSELVIQALPSNPWHHWEWSRQAALWAA